MRVEDINNIAVLGAGIMGHGIAQVFAHQGYKVRLMDISQDVLDKALDRVRLNLDMLLKKDMTSQEKIEETLGNIQKTTDLATAVTGVDFIVEAVPENLDLKKKVLQKVEEICESHTIFSTNTSTIKISEIASSTKMPENVLGVHWMLPPHIRPLVEVTPGQKTSKDTLDITRDLLIKLGKTPIVAKDSPGFIINRLQVGVFSQALKLLEEGISKEDIDRAWTHHLGLRYCLMGPIEAMDSMGLDTLYMASLDMGSVFNGPSLEPPDIVRQKFEAGEFGYKTGKGFYDYTGKSINEIIDRRDEQLVDVMQTLNIKSG